MYMYSVYIFYLEQYRPMHEHYDSWLTPFFLILRLIPMFSIRLNYTYNELSDESRKRRQVIVIINRFPFPASM